MRVPHPGVVERPATLECVYDTGGDNFYSIRWYLKGELFYSFIKGNNPEKINHNHTDVDVAMAHSDTRKVTLREIAADAEGQYRCEVMGEAPLFQTDSTTQNLTVVRLPDKPEMRVTRSSYRVGETVEVTCTARHSWPAPTLSFSVNGHHIPAESSRVRNIGVSEDNGRFYFPKGSFTSTSMLILPIERRSSSSLRLGCHALVQSLEKASFISVEVESRLSSMFSFFNAGVACWTSDAALITLTLAMLLLLQKQLTEGKCWYSKLSKGQTVVTEKSSLMLYLMGSGSLTKKDEGRSHVGGALEDDWSLESDRENEWSLSKLHLPPACMANCTPPPRMTN
ncbi:uncharacterized protein [Macrobrachium rosenbergii]|uniref:uncharacterized protein n=1 Tax=Macrobrachium rosenbergii TaxID=79674 RepID=UPI0034D794A3